VLLAICVGAILLAGVQLLTSRPRLPAGSSYSAQPDGTRALFEWVESAGGRPERLQTASLAATSPPRMLLVVEPEGFVSEADRASFDEVARQGGTLVLAGDTLPLRLYARALGVTVEPVRTRAHPPPEEWLAARQPHLNGRLVVLTTPEPLTNEGLQDDNAARFVYDTLDLASLAGQSVAFDEAHHSFVGPAPESVSLRNLLYGSAPGRAILYAGLVGFGWLLLSGRRLGPPLPYRAAEQAGRTMLEHVQTLAGLYRRARQLGAARAVFGRHYRRVLARSADTATVASALEAIEQARSERELIAAVARADEAAHAAR
jgi:hypothetical protein